MGLFQEYKSSLKLIEVEDEAYGNERDTMNLIDEQYESFITNKESSGNGSVSSKKKRRTAHHNKNQQDYQFKINQNLRKDNQEKDIEEKGSCMRCSIL